jgi:Mrp family chromosome partitioning ATPase
MGKSVGVMDADMTGPSIPHMFGVHERATGSETGILPVLSPSGIQMMSMNLLLDDESTPVVWRGMVIAGTVMQFWTDVIWKDLDLLFIDMPPGTGDVPLTVFQSIPIAGSVIVTTPQDLVEMVVKKAVNMANMMGVPVLGLVENMSYLTCPDCGKKIEVFGPSKAQNIADEYAIPAIARMPLDPKIASLADLGRVEDVDTSAFKEIFEQIEKAERFDKKDN